MTTDPPPSRDALLDRARRATRMPSWGGYEDLGGDAEAIAEFRAQGLARCRRGVATLCVVVAAMIAANVVISITLQEHWGALVLIRLAAICGHGLILGLLLTGFGERRPREIGLFAVVVTAVLMESLAAYSGGPQSVQHDRLSVLILGAAFVVGWGWRWSTVASVLVGGVFVGNALLTDALHSAVAARQLAYLGTSSVMAIVVAAVRAARRWGDFCRDRALERARHQVASSEERLRVLVETTNAIPWEADATTWQFAYVGPQAERVLGYEIERWYEDGFWMERIHPDDRESTVDYCRKASRHCRDYEFEYRMIAADGRVVWFQDLVTVEFRDGAPVMLRGFMIDITPRKEADEAIRRAREQYETLYETAPDMFLSVDLGTAEILQCNQAVVTATGWTKDELIGQPVFVLHPPESRDSRETFRRAQIEGEARNVDLQIVRKDGSRLDVSLNVNAERDETGRLLARGVMRDVTDLKRAEGALRRSEARYRAIVEDQTELICRYGRDGRLTFVNPAYCRYYGQRREDIVGTEWRPAVDPEDLGWMYTTIASLGPERPTCTIEHRVTAPDGDQRWQLWTNRAIMDEGGRVVGYQCVGRDITDRKRAEEKVERLNLELDERVRERTQQLRASEGLLRSVFLKAPMGMVLADENGRFVDTNPAFEQLVGRPHDDLQKMHISDVTHPDDLEATRHGMMALLEGREEVVSLEKRYIRPDGRTAWADTTVTLIHDSAGQFRYGLAMIQEATAWKLEEAIRAGEKQALELLAQNANLEEALGAFLDALQGADPEMQCAILLADADGRYLRHVAAFHMPDEYYLFADCLEVSPTNGSCGAAAYRRERVIVEDTVTDPLWAPYREHIESSGLRAGWLQPIISAEGTLLGTFGLYYGEPRRPTSIEIQLLEEAASVAGIIIERKRSAEMLKRHQLELAYVGRVSLVGELASGLAHELHQPLAAIVNYAGACVRRVDSGNIDQAAQLMYPIEQMRTLALRAGDIVRGLRTLIQSGNLRHERVDLNELITTATHLAQPEARHYGITLRLDLGSTLPGVEVYAIQIEQVILNLVNNGIEAMSANGRSSDELIVRSYVEPGTDGVMIAVRDGGHGLPDDPEKVFVPFFTTKRNGLGMGLAISRSIVETQGGRLWAEPNVEGGSTFLLKLPAASAPLTHPAGNGTARHTRTAS